MTALLFRQLIQQLKCVNYVTATLNDIDATSPYSFPNLTFSNKREKRITGLLSSLMASCGLTITDNRRERVCVVYLRSSNLSLFTSYVVSLLLVMQSNAGLLFIRNWKSRTSGIWPVYFRGPLFPPGEENQRRN